MANVIDSLIVLQFLRKLVTPFIQMPAYKMGIIDENGNFLLGRDQLETQEMKQACTPLDVLVINLKRLIGKFPGGKSQLASLGAAYFLLRQQPVTEETLPQILSTLKEDFEACLALAEDSPAVGVGGIAGIGSKDPFDIKISKKIQKKYKNINKIFKEQITLQYHEQMNGKLWDNMILKDEVRGKLTQIAEEFRKFCNIDPEMVQDVIITGGNCNYNYTDMSDIDLHLVVDRNMMNPNRALVDDYLQDKKILWTMSHPDIHIKGYPVELYVQDLEEQPHFGQGIYSIKDNTWIQPPQYLGLNFNDPILQSKVEYYKNTIDKMIEGRVSSDVMDVLKKKIQNMRGDSIAKGGEFAFGNLVFKELRNQGYLDKMNDYERSLKDKALSLEQVNVRFTKFIRSL